MKKYYKFLFLFLFGFFIFIPKDAFAFSLGTPTTYGDYKRCITPGASSSNCDSVSVSLDSATSALVNYNGVDSYTTQWIEGSPYSWGYVNWELGTKGYCQNQNVIMKGQIFIRNYSGVSISSLTAYMNGTKERCSFSVSQSGVIDFTCQTSDAHSGNYWQFTLSFAQKNVSTDYLLAQNVELTCSPRESQEIIANQNQNTQNIINNNIQNTDKIIENENKNHEEDQETKKGIWETIKSLPSMFLDMLLGLFIPDDFSFIDNLKESLENKLGFIAEIPVSVLEFTLNLATAGWDSFDSITLPSIEVFGVSFWNSQEISLQPAIDIFEPYKYITDFLCVILCVNTLLKWYHSFSNGGGN